MPIDYRDVEDVVRRYRVRPLEESASCDELEAFLDKHHGHAFDRKNAIGHVTGGAVVVNQDGEVLMVFHRALERWLAPGGHCDAQDHSVSGTALRELTEETGLSQVDVDLVDGVPLDIDRHEIPANSSKGEPRHEHWDFRFLFRLARVQPLQAKEDEVARVAWRPASDLPSGLYAKLRSHTQLRSHIQDD
jgi:ADP-ribose pyrophosphatase YjhB (NUDIX family)